MSKTSFPQNNENDAVRPRGDTGFPAAGREPSALSRCRWKFFLRADARAGGMTVKKSMVQDTLTRNTAGGFPPTPRFLIM